MINLKEPLTEPDLQVDLSFSGFIPKDLKSQIDEETQSILISVDEWSFVFTSWINFFQNDPSLTCPKMVRNNNIFSLGLLFTDDLYITKLNKDWRKKNVPTDVLSFSALDENLKSPPNQCVELGDIIVSVETAIKQSKLHNHSLSRELRWLVSHGFLHLLGWDHPTPSMLNRMLTLQEQLLQLNLNLPCKKVTSSDS